jgi:hypothetical protein
MVSGALRLIRRLGAWLCSLLPVRGPSVSLRVPARPAEGGNVAARKALWSAGAVALGALIATQRQDIVRYVKIKQMSYGNGHPRNVPAGGRIAYPQHDDGAERHGQSGRPAGSSAACDRTGVDPQDPVDTNSPNLQQG